MNVKARIYASKRADSKKERRRDEDRRGPMRSDLAASSASKLFLGLRLSDSPRVASPSSPDLETDYVG